MSERNVHVVIKADVSSFIREMTRGRYALDQFRRVYLSKWAWNRHRWNHRRRTGPRPLPIDGHAYRRRTRARRRRGAR